MITRKKTLYLFHLTLFAVVTFIAACDLTKPSLNPRINSITVDPVVQGEDPVVSVSVILPGISNKRVHRITAEFRSTLEPDRSYITAEEEFQSTGNNNWRGTLPALNYGTYEVRVNVVLRTGPGTGGEISPPIDELITGTRQFQVGADTTECFNFSAVANDVQGWMHGGYKLVSDGSSVEACPESVFWVNGSLRIGFGPTCFPEDQFRFDIKSPDVSARPGWPQTQGLVMRAGWNVPGMLMQPILLRVADDLPALVPLDENAEIAFFPMTEVSGGSQLFRVSIPITEGSVDQAIMRFFGAPLTSAPEGIVQLFFVCPVPDRPG